MNAFSIKNPASLIVRSLAICAVALGAAAITGWYLKIPILIQIHPDLAPMQFNTALCFALGGLAIFAGESGKPRFAAILGSVVAGTGLLTLLEYATGADFGIDRLFVHPYIVTKTEFPGRMSQLSAAMFVLSGTGMICFSAIGRRLWVQRLGGVLSSLTVTLGLIAALGYAFALIGAGGWGKLAQMAMHTSLGAIALGAALVIAFWMRERNTTGLSPSWLAPGALVCSLLGTVVFYGALRENDGIRIQRVVGSVGEKIRLEIESHLDSRKTALRRMAERWENSDVPRPVSWEKDAQAYVEDFPGYLWIAWVDENSVVQWIIPRAGNEALIGKPLEIGSGQEGAFAASRLAGDGLFSNVSDLMGFGERMLLPEPLFLRGGFAGFMTGSIGVEPLLDSLLTEARCKGYRVTIIEDGRPIFAKNPEVSVPKNGRVANARIDSYGVDWVAQVEPTIEEAAALASPYPNAILVAGCSLSFLLALAISFARSAESLSHKTLAANRSLEISTQKLRETQELLSESSRKAGMTEVATNVIHNVGNVLNSVNISCSTVAEKISSSRVGTLRKTSDLLSRHSDDLADFVSKDPAGSELPGFLAKLAGRMEQDEAEVLAELGNLENNIGHIKEIIAMQQLHATVSRIEETVSLEKLVDDSIRMNKESLERHDVRIISEHGRLAPLNVQKHKVIQILVNLISNAKQACMKSATEDRQIIVRTYKGNGVVRVSVTDNGVGIPEANLNLIFGHGFTTKREGHGFGLHASALAAAEMGGRLTATSPGPGKGATFILELPAGSAVVT